MEKKLQTLISYLHHLDHIDMDKMDDMQLADILWLSMQITEAQEAKENKSIKEFWEWLQKWWSLLSSIDFSKKNETSSESDNESKNKIDTFFEEETLPLIPKTLKTKHNFSIKIPQKKDFFATDDILKALKAFDVNIESNEESMELDEEATVEYLAQTNILSPKFYAQTEKYYDLYLMLDTSASMTIWQESMENFIKKLQIFSIFRNIKLLYLDSSKEEAIIYNNKSKSSKASKLLNPEGRCVLFICSDCISPAWSRGDMLEKIYEYQTKIPTSIINMLPRRMWKGTVLRQTNITRLKRENRVLNSDIDSLLLSFDKDYFKQDILRIPVVNFSKNDFEAMSQIMTGQPNSSCTGILASKREFLNTQKNEKTEELTAKNRVQEFFNHSASTAHKLALYLSTCTHLNFPIMKMIQHNMLPKSTQLDLAEFFVGGLLNKEKKDDNKHFYIFHTGVRELLQENLSPYKSAEILERNSNFIAKNIGSSLDFSAILMHDTLDDEWTDEDKIFAEMSLSVLERLGGNYSKEVAKIRKKRFDTPSKNEKLQIITPTTKSFLMGSNEGRDNEKPIHKVTINYDFEIAQYPVTFEEYDLYCEAQKIDKPSDEGWGRGKRPIINVSWNDAQAYIKWLNEQTGESYRLPTEAEWEYSARAGTTTKWSFGDDEKSLSQYAWYDKNSYDLGKEHKDYGTHIVGEKESNPWGLHDMHGNVDEWCEDDYTDNYNEIPRDGSPNKKGKEGRKVLRGGSWNFSDYDTRSAIRSRSVPAYCFNNVGFRLLRTLP